MGDRGSIYIRGRMIPGTDGEHAPGVYLYSHGDGTDLPTILQQALDSRNGRSRMNQSAYLARIIFSNMTRGYEDAAHGYGISAEMQDDDGWPLLAVDAQTQRVYVVPNEEASHPNAWIDAYPEAALNVEEFIAISTDGWEGLQTATDVRLAAAKQREEV